MEAFPVAEVSVFLGKDEAAIEDRLASFQKSDFISRLLRKDPSIWNHEPDQQKAISNSIGWLDVVDKMKPRVEELKGFADEVREAGFTHVVHMGMGGSSLAPLAFQQTFGVCPGGLPLTVLDSTDPATVAKIARELDIANTLFIEASKSGGTVESRSFGEYFYAKVKKIKGERAGDNFAVITDPGSMLESLAKERNYRRIFLNFADIGGRYSALSYFGLVPAALLGIDVSELLGRAGKMMDACSPEIPLKQNPAVLVGTIMGELSIKGRDKLTFFVPKTMSTLGMWLEQLIAESTGKEGRGILPVAGEAPGERSSYGNDRLFVHIRLAGEPEPAAVENRLEALKKAGVPVVVVQMADRYDIAQEMYRWEIATATAGAVLAINPFDQPNVQESKDFTKRLLSEVKETGRLPAEGPGIEEGPIKVWPEASASSVREALSKFLGQAKAPNYIAFLAYLTEDAGTERALQRIRHILRDRLKVATTNGFGPRYLHSTGQLHKGGPDTGLFLLFTSDGKEDVEIPGQPYTFGTLLRAQAIGDLEVLRKHGRRAMRINLGPDTQQGLNILERLIGDVLGG